MNATKRYLFCLALIVFPLSSDATFLRAQSKPDDKPAKRADVFGPDKIWDLHLKLGAKEFKDLDPKSPSLLAAIFGKKDDKKDEKADVHVGRGMGNQYPYVKGDLEFHGTALKDVGIRYKGNSSYNASQGSLRRPFKIDVNHYSDQKLHGLGGFALANGAWDTTRIHDALGYHLFRAAKVPASRTAFVKLSLTVPEKHDAKYVGLYTMLEPIDKTFLRERFGDADGMLLKPEQLRGLDYLGENWKPYGERYYPKREPNDAQKKRLIEFVKLVNKANDADFNAKVGDYLDIDAFLRYAAVNSLLANLDSFFCTAHNYYLYLNPKDNRFHFIPWDLDLAFGGFIFAGKDQTEWTIEQPYIGKNRLTERLLAVPANVELFRKHLKTLVDGAFSIKEMTPTIDAMEAAIKDALAKEPKMSPQGAWLFSGKPPPLREFIAKRGESVAAQLDGKSKGKYLKVGFPFGGLNGPEKKAAPKAESPKEQSWLGRSDSRFVGVDVVLEFDRCFVERLSETNRVRVAWTRMQHRMQMT